MLSFRVCVLVFFLATVLSVHVFAFEDAPSFDANSILSQVRSNKIRKKAFKTAKNVRGLSLPCISLRRLFSVLLDASEHSERGDFLSMERSN